jgi:hypothetical protein
MINLNAQFVKVLAPWNKEPWLPCYIFGLPASAISLDYEIQ